MKIVLTGSIGNIGKPLVQALVQKGHDITVISSKSERSAAIRDLGASPAIGRMEDIGFLTKTFRGADIVYLMESLDAGAFFNPDIDVIAAATRIGENYKAAVEQSGIKKIIHLSSIGADKGPGLLRFHNNVENILRQLPEDVNIKYMRPVGFFTNLYAFIPSIKTHHTIFANYGGDDKEPWVAPWDIAAVITEEMELPFQGRMVRYIASDEVSTHEIAKSLGAAIGHPDLKWQVISDEQMLEGLIGSGMNPQTAKGFVAMTAARSNAMYADYRKHPPVLGQVKLKDFAREFKSVFQQNQ